MCLGKLIFLVFLAPLFDLCMPISLSHYLQIRKNAIISEKKSYFGAHLVLEGDEILANKCLMSAKFDEINKGYRNISAFLPSRNFLNVREEIERSKVFKLIKLMPKGASLHTHSTAAVSLGFLYKNLTFMPNLYICINETSLRFWFFKSPGNDCDWKLLDDVRTRNLRFDFEVKQYLALPTEKSTSEYNSALIWEKFERLFDAYKGLISYKPAFEKYIYQALQEVYDDGILFMELRYPSYHLYDLDGTIYSQVEVLTIFKQSVDKFIADHPDFIGAKLIYSPSKVNTKVRFDQEVKIFREIKNAFPDLVIGFDLVGEEEKINPLLDFAGELLQLAKETTFYFHAGETNWLGHDVDENLFDAVLMTSKRIGHGLALSKHPKLMEIVKKKHIAIEVSPISNQVLGYVTDMRNHPASHYFAQNLIVVVTNDDPSFWGALGLSHDFYEAFVGIMSRHADLRTLKQLAINSILCSGLNDKERRKAMNIWNNSWWSFVKYVAYDYDCN